MAISKKLQRKLTGNNPRIKVDLAEIFGRLPKDSDAIKEAVGGALLDRIRERTKSGNFLEQSSGAGSYSKEYANSFEFKVFGKSKDKVNMTASGDMLREMDITNRNKNTIEIGWEDDQEAEKAHGHITGAVGKKRDFFGVTDSDISDIKKEFSDDVKKRLKLESGSITTGESRHTGEDVFSFLRRVIGNNGIS